MKSRYEFLNDFLDKLSEFGFVVETTNEIDIIAEIYDDEKLFCLITSDGEIIYENNDEEKINEFEIAISEVQSKLDINCSQLIENLDESEQVILSRGGYYKIIESSDTALLCRYNGVFGYEFVTCKKLPKDNHTRKYYREKMYFNFEQAQANFNSRSNLKFAEATLYSQEELKLVLACLTRVIYLDNSLDVKMESAIKELIDKTENVLPPAQTFSPRDYFEREQ